MSGRESSPAPIVRCLEIKNRFGLHARAAALLVEALKPFEAEITITKEDQTVNGRSIIGLMMLAAAPGSVIEITADGPDAAAAMEAIAALVEARFHEEA